MTSGDVAARWRDDFYMINQSRQVQGPDEPTKALIGSDGIFGKRTVSRFGDQGMMTSVEETTRTEVTGIPSRRQRSKT